jgi:DNA-binding NarL/FixJ family response regulator
MSQDEAPNATRSHIPAGETPCDRLGLLIVSEVRFLREALAELLHPNPMVTVLGLCENIEEAIRNTVSQQPDIVLLDAGFTDGAGAARRLRRVVPDLSIVVMAVSETAENVISWAEAGAIGYVPQTAALADLVGILVRIARGDQICSAQIASGLLRHVARTARSSPGSPLAPAVPLTRREREIGLLIGAGLSNKDIARKLNIGVATAKSHVHNLLIKMNVQRRGQAANRIGLGGGGLDGLF